MKLTFTSKAYKIAGVAIIILMLFSFANSFAQTPGIIFDKSTSTAGRLVLDRNGDGYTSASSSGFVTNDVTESEMQFTTVPQISQEPSGDIRTAPTCGFTDFSDYSSDNSAVGIHMDSSNSYMVFRFRMSSASSNSKGYSVLIDADGKFGNTGANADPNYVAPSSSNFGNPGFEVEILLATNFGVYIYNVDGTASPGAASVTYAGHSNYQKSIALNTVASCSGKTPVFIDFYVKVSDLSSLLTSMGYSMNTGFRYAVNTVTSPHRALLGPISDVAGVNDAAYSNNYSTIWSLAVTGQASTTASNTSSMDSICPAPTVGSPIYSTATSITVTNNDTKKAGYITVYRKRSNVTTKLGTTASIGSGSTGSLGSISGLAAGDLIWATDSVLGETPSLNSNIVTVSSCGGTPTAPVITCYSAKGVNGSTVYPGATINIYSEHNTPISSFTGSSSLSGGVYVWSYNPKTTGNASNACGTGQNNANVYGAMYFTITTAGGCTSKATYSSISSCTNTSTPAVTSLNYSTGAISGTSTVASDSIAIFKNGNYLAVVGAASNAWTYTGGANAFSSSDTILVGEYTAYTSCMSSLVLAMNVPVVSSPLYPSSTSIKGTSTAPAGTYVDVYKNGTAIGHTTVTSYGTWTLSYSSLAAGNTITAYDSVAGYKSAVSNTVTVSAAPTSILAYVTGPVTENLSAASITVNGTLSSSSTGTVNLYEDGTLIASASVSASTTVSWTTNNTRTMSLDNYLYAGSYLTATFTPTGGTEGTNGNTVQVQCQPASQSLTVNSKQYKYCSTSYPTVTVASSEAGVIYTMVNNGTLTSISPSILGTGGTITLTANNVLGSSKTVQVTAQKISIVSCTYTENDTAYLREDCDAAYINNTYNADYIFHVNDVLATVSDPDGAITAASISSGTLPAGTALNTSNGNIYVTNPAQLTSGSWPLTINTTDNHTFVNGTGSTVYGTSAPTVTVTLVSPLPVTLLDFSGKVDGSMIDLNWTTATEINNNYFDVERSIDTRQFESIGRVQGHGTTNTINQYAFTDESPLFGTSYYRLKQVDFNGEYTYSNIISFDLQSKDKTTLKVYPNPLTKPSVLHVDINTSKNEIITMSLVDIAGQQVEQTAPLVISGDKTVDLNVNNLKHGFYFLRVQTSTEVIIEKIEIL